MEMELWNRLCNAYEDQVTINKDFRSLYVRILAAAEEAYRQGNQGAIAAIRQIIGEEKANVGIPEEPKPKIAAQILKLVQSTPKRRKGKVKA